MRKKLFKNIFCLLSLALLLDSPFVHAYKFCVINQVPITPMQFYPIYINAGISIQRSAKETWDSQGTIKYISNINISNQGCIEISPAPFTNLAAFADREKKMQSVIKFDITPSYSMYGLEPVSCQKNYPQENNPPEDVQAIVTESSGKLVCQVIINKL